MVVIRFANPRGIDFPYLLNMMHDSFMSRANTIVVPGGKMELAMQLIFTPGGAAVTGLDEFFDLTIGGDSLPEKKPHASVLRHVAGRAGCAAGALRTCR
jgi:hypothetical protein